MVGLIILCLFLAGLAGALFSRLRRVNARWVEFSNVLERLGQGDLSASVPRPEGRIYLDIAGHIEEIKGRLVRLQNQHSKENLNLRGILDSMIEGVMVVDNLGKIRLANERLKNLFAMEESPHGRSIMEASRNHRLQEVFLKASKVGRVLGEEIVISPSIGQELYFELNALRLEGEEEQFAGVVFVFHDITRIRRLETTRREFVTNASHELRTPLSIIKGYVETLADGAIDDPKTARKFVGIMHKHTERLTELVEDMLDLSRLESGRQELRPEKVDIRPLLLRLIQSFHTLTSRKKNHDFLRSSAGQPFVGNGCATH
ncbi:histidine kinase dimerization/phospho-acceptor domain-containing protein [Kamptonema cortianum]|nr:histidine kinase dimerization/phospho-acceptor domain-containing protein [Kamptonema cortianum]